MNKTLIAVCLLAALVASASAERNLQRYLQQSFTCSGVKELSGRCSNLCCCVGKKNPALAKLNDMCKKMCNDCISSCSSGSGALPKVCEQGLGMSGVKDAVQSCLSEYQNAKNKEEAIKQYNC